MKYLIDPNAQNWEAQCKQLEQIYKKIRTSFPVEFFAEFDEHWFHDNELYTISVAIDRANPQSKIVTMQLHDYDDKAVWHTMTFHGVSTLMLNIDVSKLPWLAWVYCEILPIKQHRFSLEVALSDDIHSLYLEFLSLDYQKNTFSQL